MIAPYSNALCASADELRRAGETVAIVCSDEESDKAEAIIGALRTGLIDTLITDEHTAQAVLERESVM